MGNNVLCAATSVVVSWYVTATQVSVITTGIVLVVLFHVLLFLSKRTSTTTMNVKTTVG